ncbi:MAG TPA: tRNA (adenosine(37)-N6)-threonylcarbamoyltransferase complex ATPase subunit type 1 TsaE [Candidatus Saccharimonadia bacterium]|nr:tRNA (adenosine(37)-N6)-threonylcarbamoyltransferase complex ATPase subunit type 1 TsaE [Candidatus Saccharimonadia bacterium]
MLSLVAQRRLTVQAEETRALGARLGRWARAGDIVACRGALGAGKTTFVQGFAEGLGVGGDAYVRSPTFALVHAYHGRIPLYHFDFYRLSSCAEVQDIGFEEYLDAGGVVIIEWADRFPEILPPMRLEVSIRIADSDRRWLQWMAYDTSYSRYFLHTD